jgi:hypothetical protein
VTKDTWYVGDLWKITVAITDPDTGAAADPTTLVITVIDPSTGETTPSVSHPATGSYKAQASLTKPGEWQAIITATGSYQSVETQTISVKKPKRP